jgi:UDP-GlcNAc:undecaprenyl-phosphate GlcNAc-1-phosphate transferase
MPAVSFVYEVVFAFVAALVISLAAVPLFSWLGRKVGLVDVPDEHRKLHRNAIPLIGGLAIFCSSLLAIGVVFGLRLGVLSQWPHWNSLFEFRSGDFREFGGLLLGGAVLLLVGVLDDRFGLRGRQKLLGQLLACAIVIIAGFRFEVVEIRSSLFDFDLNFGSFAAIVSCLWLLAAINSINLLDGADGFAGTIGAVIGVAFCIMAIATNHIVDAAVIAAFTGAIIGFLRFNFPPAKVYLGDAGSMLIGFFFAALAIRCTFKQATAYAFFGPMALLAIPFLDTGAAIIRRRLTGRSIYSVDRAHLHHILAGHGYGPRASLLLVGLLCALTAAGGTLSVITHQSEYAVVAIGIVTIFLVANRIFGFAEFKLILSKFAALYRSLKSFRNKSKDSHRQTAIQLQGRRDWQLIWHNVREFSEKYDFKTVRLHLHLPWLHEIYHARYDKVGAQLTERDDEWYFAIPLNVQKRFVGEIEVEAFKNEDVPPYEIVAQLMEMLADLEEQFVEIIESSAQDVETNEDSDVRTIPLKGPTVRPGERGAGGPPSRRSFHFTKAGKSLRG